MFLKLCADAGYIAGMKYVSENAMKFWKSLIFDTQSKYFTLYT